MRVFFSILLHIIHFIYSLFLKTRWFWQQPINKPQPLLAPRSRIPKNLAILFVTHPGVDIETTKSILEQSVLNAIRWCRSIGIKKLTVYEENDILSQCAESIRSSLPVHVQESDSGELDIYYPPTPPPSDYSDSRPLSPNDTPQGIVPVTTIHVVELAAREETRKRTRHQQPEDCLKVSKNELFLSIISREASKPAIASAAQALAQIQSRRTRKNAELQKDDIFVLGMDELDRLLEDEDGLSSPDFMIIHHLEPYHRPSAPSELHGFPPWHIRLTELYHSQPRSDSSLKWPRFKGSPEPTPLDEMSFRNALDEFASAEMRFGK